MLGASAVLGVVSGVVEPIRRTLASNLVALGQTVQSQPWPAVVVLAILVGSVIVAFLIFGRNDEPLNRVLKLLEGCERLIAAWRTGRAHKSKQTHSAKHAKPDRRPANASNDDRDQTAA